MTTAPYFEIPTATSTRLLTLHPGPKWSDIEASLSVVDLQGNQREKKNYEALSYTWGEAGNEKSITVSGYKMQIRYNLWSFLQRIRQEAIPRVVWVDALCISQTNLAEKGQQVAMIGEIFKTATRVLAWVGEHSNGSEQLYRSYGRFFGHIRELSRSLSEEQAKKLVGSWVHFTRRPYWGRTWIIQEILLARDVLVFCGDDTIRWKFLTGISLSSDSQQLRLLDSQLSSLPLPKEDHKDTSAPQRFANLHRARTSFHATKPYLWFANKLVYSAIHYDHRPSTIMSNFSETSCEERRDKIFALLALMDVNDRIHPDYKSPIVQIFIQACHRWLKGVSNHRNSYEAEHLLMALHLTNLELSELLAIICDDTQFTAMSNNARLSLFYGVISYIEQFPLPSAGEATRATGIRNDSTLQGYKERALLLRSHFERDRLEQERYVQSLREFDERYGIKSVSQEDNT